MPRIFTSSKGQLSLLTLVGTFTMIGLDRVSWGDGWPVIATVVFGYVGATAYEDGKRKK
jgi:hypothetical protein